MSTRRLLVIAVALLALSGCGAPQAVPAPSPTASPAAAAPTATPTPTPTPVSPIPPSTAMDPSLFFVPDWAGGVSFVSPSGNLSCGILTYNGSTIDLWGCTIREKYWEFPDDSPGDYCYDYQEISCGSGIASRPAEDGGIPTPLARGGAEFADEAGFATRTLQYGEAVTYLGITCASTSEHVICADDATGHGFVISRDENTIF